MNKIVDVRLVQSNEVASSSHMELEGLKRSLEFLDDGDVMIGELVTDRHPQVRKYLRTQRPGVSHLIDAWHVSKGLKKKLLAASKSKGCDAIALWCESIVNHIYHAVQVGAGDADLAEAVWLSVLNHIKDKHDGHSALYDRCKHGDLKPRKWIYPGVHWLLSITTRMLGRSKPGPVVETCAGG
ncbi:uncharacterized protein LOC144143607 isoform X2 [Haemaphysalis longicornis]